MAPRDTKQDTYAIVRCLFDDDEALSERQGGCIEIDGPDDDTFDPVLIADKLKQVADKLNTDKELQAALSQLKKAMTHEALETAFSQSVETLSQVLVSQNAEVAQEMQLIKASINLGLYVKRMSPDLIHRVQTAMATFLSARVGSWVIQQGGWDVVAGN